MKKPTKTKKRNKLIVALLAPTFIIVLIIGWSLYWIGQSRSAKQTQKPIKEMLAKQDEVELIVIPLEEKQILAN